MSQAEKTDEHIFSLARERLERLYKKAIAANENHLARLLVRDMCRLYGLNKPERARFGPMEPEVITVELIDDELSVKK